MQRPYKTQLANNTIISFSHAQAPGNFGVTLRFSRATTPVERPLSLLQAYTYQNVLYSFRSSLKMHPCSRRTGRPPPCMRVHALLIKALDAERMGLSCILSQ